jgi:hypothetical protein
MQDKHEVGPDVDLEAEEIRDRQGRRVTGEYADRAATDALRIARPGRPAPGAVGQHSARVSFRYPVRSAADTALNAASGGR